MVCLSRPYPFKFLNTVFHKFYMVHWIFCSIHIVMSSAELQSVVVLIKRKRSLINMLKSRGRFCHLLNLSHTLTLWYLLEKKLWIKVEAFASKPLAFILQQRRLWFSVSKAFERSITIAQILLPLFSIACHVSIIFRRACWALWFLLKSDRYFGSLVSIKELIWVKNNFSNVFAKIRKGTSRPIVYRPIDLQYFYLFYHLFKKWSITSILQHVKEISTFYTVI